MPRKPIIRTSEFPYHIVARTNDRKWFSVPLEIVWQVLLDEIEKCHIKYELKVYALVLMSNHFHTICQTPESNIDKVMWQIMNSSSKRLHKIANTSNHLYGGPYKWSLIKSERYLRLAYKYVLQNPVRAGIVRRIEEYPFSSMYNLNRYSVNRCFFVHPIFNLKKPEQIKNHFAWLNKVPPMKMHDAVRSAIRQREFKIQADSMKEHDNLIAEY